MKSIFKLLVLAVIAIFALVTNPDKATHQDKFAEQYKKSHPIAGNLGGGKLLSSVFDYSSYYVFSTCSTSKSGLQTIGAFGQIFVVADVTEKLPELDDVMKDAKKKVEDITEDIKDKVNE